MKIYLQQQILIMLRKIATFKYSKALYQKYVCKGYTVSEKVFIGIEIKKLPISSWAPTVSSIV